MAPTRVCAHVDRNQSRTSCKSDTLHDRFATLMKDRESLIKRSPSPSSEKSMSADSASETELEEQLGKQMRRNAEEMHEAQTQQKREPESEIIDLTSSEIELWSLQKGMRDRLSTGESLHSVVKKLKQGRYRPERDNWLILRVCRADVFYRGSLAVRRYYVFDHRRARCMFDAGCKKVRISIVMEGDVFDEFIRKADSFGTHIRHTRIRFDKESETQYGRRPALRRNKKHWRWKDH